MALECRDEHKGSCKGEVNYVMDPFDWTRSFPRCKVHGNEWIEFLIDNNNKYGTYSDCAPEGFDPADAGECWDEDY